MSLRCTSRTGVVIGTDGKWDREWVGGGRDLRVEPQRLVGEL